MRRGEVLGLNWSDVDLDACRLAVPQTLSAPRNPDTASTPHLREAQDQAGSRWPVVSLPERRAGPRPPPGPALMSLWRRS
jgi:integrase